MRQKRTDRHAFRIEIVVIIENILQQQLFEISMEVAYMERTHHLKRQSERCPSYNDKQLLQR